MNTWEYYVVTISEKDVEHDIDKAHVMESTSIEGRLNYWGGQGWELVALLPAIPGTNAQESIHRSAEHSRMNFAFPGRERIGGDSVEVHWFEEISRIHS